MLDTHVISGTPGAATVLGSNFTTIPTGDGQTQAGVPIAPGAVLVGWGGCSITADTIGALKLQSQDQIDPINGKTFTPGAASLLNVLHDYENLPYKSGGRFITMGTNTGVTNCMGYYMDYYKGGPCIVGSRSMQNQVSSGITTFGGALTTLVWGSQPYSPTTALPNGQYAILGAYVTAIANAAVIRFQHSDFGQFMPGFPVANSETISTSTWDKIDKDSLLINQAGMQFVYLSEVLGVPCVPVFSVTNGGTGLVIWMASAQGDTPVVTLVLAKVK